MRNFLIILCLWAPYLITAQIFINQEQQYGVSQYSWDGYLGSGCTAADINGDGWDDLTFGNTSGAIRIYLNTGGNGFIISSIPINQDAEAKTIQWVDIDNDHDLDFFYTDVNGRTEILKNNGGLDFENVTEDSGLPQDLTIASGSSWGDYDNDGDLDLYICRYIENPLQVGPQYRNVLLRNEGDFQFTNVSQLSATDIYKRLSFQSIWYDWDRDGWLDLYVINDKTDPNALFHNLQDGTFEEISADVGADIVLDAMTASLGDFNQDGYEDIFCTSTVIGNDSIGSQLLLGSESGVYTEASEEYGLNFQRYCWGALWMDMDNDTDLDLFVAESNFLYPYQENYLYENLGPEEGFNFEIVSEDVYGTDLLNSNSVISGDFDQNGWIDFVVHNTGNHKARIWMNSGFNDDPAKFIQLGLKGRVSNTGGVGSFIELTNNGTKQIRTTMLGENYLGQESHYEHFGLGEYDDNEEFTVDTIKVTWPSGVVDVWLDYPAGQRALLNEGSSPCDKLNDTELDICIGFSSELEVETHWDEAEVFWSFTPAVPGESSGIPVSYQIASSNTVEVDMPGTYSANVYHQSEYLCNGSVDVGIMTLTGDLDSDGAVSINDLLMMIAGFGCEDSCEGDINNDGAQTVSDLLLMLISMGVMC